MEIERKWMVNGWPEQANASLRLLWTEYQEQGYVHTIPPIVRIRLEAPLYVDGRELARATARYTGQQLAWEAM